MSVNVFDKDDWFWMIMWNAELAWAADRAVRKATILFM